MTISSSGDKAISLLTLVRWFRSFTIRNQFRHSIKGLARSFARIIDKFGFHSFFKYLWLRIVFLNLIGLILVVAGVYYLSGFRASLIDLKVKGLTKQGEIIAAVISASHAAGRGGDDEIDVDAIWMYQDKNSKSQSSHFSEIRFDLNPQKIGPFLQKTVELTNTRARVYEADGGLLVDSNRFLSSAEINRALTPKQEPETVRHRGIFFEFTRLISQLFHDKSLPLYEDIGEANGKKYSEVRIALTGQKSTIIRVTKDNQTIVSVATPIKSGRDTAGVLLLTTGGVEIDEAVKAARNEIMRLAFVALIVSLTLSLYLTVTIAGPMRALSKAMKNVKRSIKKRHDIPDLTHRPDEIGQLSIALRDMTFALYDRIEAIERFAADVSHELKNPLTSLRSAVETLPLAKRPEDREHLIEVILNDVGRLNRLITDIASVSRLDAELALADKKPIDMILLLTNLAEVFNDIRKENNNVIVVDYMPQNQNGKIFYIQGHESRLGQVFTNLLDNALSFSDDGGKVWISVRRLESDVEITVEDEGPGIPEDNLDKIFARFYTDRPGENAFRENSGLGLNISQEIVNAHGGRIWAENRYSKESKAEIIRKPIGAKFTVVLPASHAKK